MADLEFKMLLWQQKVFADKARFKVVVAGRRCGKSKLAAMLLLIKGLECPAGSHVMYVAPTQGQARTIIWQMLLELGYGVITGSHVNNMRFIYQMVQLSIFAGQIVQTLCVVVTYITW